MWSQSVSTRNASEKVRRPAAQAPRPSAHVARVSLRTTLPSNRVPSAANSRARAPQVPTPKLGREHGQEEEGAEVLCCARRADAGRLPDVGASFSVRFALSHFALTLRSHASLSHFPCFPRCHTSHASPHVTLPILPLSQRRFCVHTL